MMGLLKAVLPSVFGTLDELIEDKDKRNELKASINQKLLTLDESTIKAQAGLISAEANGESWLQRNWRPVTMLTFAGCVVAHWLGFTPENLTEAEVMGLLDIVQIGLGGYVVGRSAEKVAKSWPKQ